MALCDTCQPRCLGLACHVAPLAGRAGAASRLGIIFLALCCAWSCNDGGQTPDSPPVSTPTPTPAPPIDLSRFHFPIDVDYNNPSRYLQGGSQSTLTAANVTLVDGQIQVPTKNLEGVGRIFKWIGANFAGVSGGGATVGRTDVNDLLRDRTLLGCHDWGLLYSTLLRHFGYPAVMVDGAGIDWAERFRNGQTSSYAGHVYVEAHVEGKWILLNSTSPLYVASYDFQQPVLPFTQTGDGRGHYVLYKGVDPAGYGVTSSQILQVRMLQFTQVLPSLSLFFPTYDIRTLPGA
jgi:hypothetical protein